jgi:hypothetical protein
MSAPDRLAGVLSLAALFAAVVLALSWPPATPPQPVPASADAAAFSAERARAHLRELARVPRPVGSAAHAEARAYLVDALRQLGLEPELQQATGIRISGDTIRAAALVNVMARLPGTDSSGAVVLLAHYDSVPNAPGAADAGNGVAAILETVRALRAGPPLRNDVIVLISDAEEVGLLGAQAWVDEHPWAADTGIVLNAEGRGHAGPVQMFRTTANNGEMIRTLARAAPYPAAESLANEIFRLMPNDTDLSVFAAAGYAGMDFANVHGLTHYHTPLDNFENADPRTLQHHGSYLLSLARAFGDSDLARLAAPDRIYFSVALIGLVHYPQAWALGLAALATLLALLVVAWAARRGTLHTRGALKGLLHFTGALLALPLLAMAAWRLVAGFLPEVAWFAHGSPYGSGRYLLGIGLLATALYVGAAGRLLRPLTPAERLAGPMCLWALLGLCSAWWLPGASYLFLWPLVSAAIGLAWWQSGARRSRGVHEGVLVVLGWPALLLIVPLIEGVEAALTLDKIAVAIVLLVFCLGLLALQLDILSRGLGRAWPALLLVAGLAVLGMAVHGAGIDAERKKPNSVHYIADLDAAEALWYSLDPAPDEWTRHYLGEAPRRATLPAWAPETLAGPDGVAWQRPAAPSRVPGPRAELLSEIPTGQGRRLRFRITSPVGAHSTVIRFPAGGQVGGLWIDGREVPRVPAEDGRALQLLYFSMPQEGMVLELLTAGMGPVRMYLRANLLGLPAPESGAVPARPGHMMPAGQLGDLTRLQRTFEF